MVGTIFVESFLAFLIGMVLFFALPIYTLGKASDWFVELAMNCVRRGVLLKRLNAGYSLKSSRFNADEGTEQISASGQTYDLEDPRNFMSRFKGKPFGLSHEGAPIIVAPHIADLGRQLARHKRNGSLRDSKGRFRKYFEIDPGTALVNLDDVLHVVQGSAPPQGADIIREYTKKGQHQFNTSRAATFLIWIIMLAAGAGIPYFLLKLKDTLGGTTMGKPLPGYIVTAAMDMVVIGI